VSCHVSVDGPRALVARGPLASLPASTSSTGDWTATVYYTAVESFHHEPAQRVVGCRQINCEHGADNLGAYPADFISAVHDEGTGRITSGRFAGRYLNWSSNVGYWLDDAPRDAHGRPLDPFRSAAADGLADLTEVRLVDCGHDDTGAPIAPNVCDRLRSAAWQIRDEFTPGLGGQRHIDLYVGEETGPDFRSAPLYTTMLGARLELR
jgi:hypothetical protein